jgi:hypothetical protein
MTVYGVLLRTGRILGRNQKREDSQLFNYIKSLAGDVVGEAF